MKNLILITCLFVLLFNTKVFSQESEDYSTELSAKLSYVLWSNANITDYYGGMVIFGGGIERQISDDFKLCGEISYGATREDDVNFSYLQFFGDVEYFWWNLNSEKRKPNIYGTFGAGLINPMETWDGGSYKGNGFAFRIGVGAEIPIGEKTKLNLGWRHVISSIKYGDSDDTENINFGNMQFFACLLFEL